MKITTLKGRQIDIAALRERHGATVALGNANMNARGDIVGRGGVVVRSSEEITKDYYESNPNAVTNAAPISLKDISDEIVMTPREAMKAFDEKRVEAATSKRKSRETED